MRFFSRNVISMLGFLMLSLLFSCNNSGEEPHITIHSPSDAQVHLSDFLGLEKVNFIAKGPWEVVIKSVDSPTSWIEVTPMSGDAGYAQLLVKASPNQAKEERRAEIIIKTLGQECPILCIQNSFKPTFSLPVSQEEVSSLESTLNISVLSNIPWTVSSNQDWISFTQTKGSGSDRITVRYLTNDTDSVRHAHIRFLADDFEETFVLTQDFIKRITLSQSYQHVTGEAGEVSFMVNSNDKWTIVTASNWFSVSPQEGKDRDFVRIVYTANNTGKDRIEKIEVNCGPVTSKYLLEQSSIEKGNSK